MIILQNVVYHPNAKLLKSKSAENDYQSEGLYAGPEFANLDEDLQVLFERYLDERGINTALALFVPDYIEYKEQKEYLRWLESKTLNYPEFVLHLLWLTQIFYRCKGICRCLDVNPNDCRTRNYGYG